MSGLPIDPDAEYFIRARVAHSGGAAGWDAGDYIRMRVSWREHGTTLWVPRFLLFPLCSHVQPLPAPG